MIISLPLLLSQGNESFDGIIMSFVQRQWDEDEDDKIEKSKLEDEKTYRTRVCTHVPFIVSLCTYAIEVSIETCI